MANTRQHPILDYLRRVLGEASGGGVGDADLLRRFVDLRDEAAFELLLWRHAAMVLHVCRQVLGDEQAAEDAFQATFLVFVRKASSISRREALGSWLYRVAYRIALKARSRAKTRAAAPEELDCLAAPAESETAEQRELRRIICEEVNRLPADYRAAVVACFFEGKTHEEAAKQLGWPRGTVAGRLTRARDLLRRRLLRRGVTLTLSALLTGLAAGTAQAALTGLVDSVIHTARLVAAGQAAAAVSPHVAALAEGVLQTMYWTKTKFAVVALFLASLGGAGVSLLATQEQERPPVLRKAALVAPQPGQTSIGGTAQAETAPASDNDEDDEPAQALAAEEPQPQDVAKLAHEMARSRLNLKKLALAMHNYADTHLGQLPTAATVGQATPNHNAKALLSWRVELLPYLGEGELYNQFKRDEPWDSPHNRKLLSKMPAVYSPPGVKTQRPYSTFYQVFVSARPSESGAAAGAGGSGMMAMMGGAAMPGGGGSSSGGFQGGAPGGGAGTMPPSGRTARGSGGRLPGGGGAPSAGGAGAPGRPPGGPQPGAPGGAAITHHPTTPVPAFIKGEATPFPVWFLDGTSNTILIIEAGNPVPWTKPEDLHYADDEPLPELGGLFPNVIHAAFADGAVHTLTKNYNKKQLHYAITVNDGMVMDLAKIEARSPRSASDRGTVDVWQRKNEELRLQLEQTRQQMRLLKEEQEVERELAGEDPRVRQLKDEHARMQAELKKLRDAIDAMKKGNNQPREAK